MKKLNLLILGLPAVNSSVVNVPSGSGKLGYPSGTAGLNYDGLLKNYQLSGGALQEVCFYNYKLDRYFLLCSFLITN